MREPGDRFLWGVATSAAQIEGAVDADGRGESIWDRFAAGPGNIADGSNPSQACDHFRLWQDDVERLRWLGVDAYRFSIAWPRILPAGRGRVRAAGLDFYDRLVDALLAAGIDPFVTLYHWDLPQALQDAGGWGARDTVEAFADYADVVARRLGDRVRHWVTHNEPWCIATLGHEEAHHAPGHRDPREALRVAHHLLLSHSRAASRIRRAVPGAAVGIVLNLTPVLPASPSAADRDAARQVDGRLNRWFLEPLFRGAYPSDAVADRVREGHLDSAAMPFVHAGDLEAIAEPMDFLGVNYYSRVVVRAGENGAPEPVRTVPEADLTDMGWEVQPAGLHDLLLHLHREYAPGCIYVTENGAAYADGPDDAGQVADDRRVAFLRDHVAALQGARSAGVPVAGYFVWSLLDNFEWGHGYAKRFGLFWVDFDTQKRVPKDSAFWYRDVIAAGSTHAGSLPHLPRRIP